MNKHLLALLSCIALLGITFHAQAQCPGTSNTKSSFPFNITFLEAKVTGGVVKLTFDVQNIHGVANFEFVSFQLPEKTVAISPKNSYSGKQQTGGTLTQIYSVSNPSYDPSYGIKFYNPSSPGNLKNSKSDIFSYEISAYDFVNMQSLTVTAGSKNNANSVVTFDLRNNGQLLPCITDISTQLDSVTAGHIVGEENPLVGSTVTYRIKSDFPLHYNWVVPAGWQIMNGQKTNAITVLVGDQRGTISSVLKKMSASNDKVEATYTRMLAVTPYSPLPVELVTFTGVARNSAVELNWSTATEINNERFEVEHSTNGKDFVKIGVVKGEGNSNVLRSYRYTDHSPVAGTGYYRLKQVDFDQAFEYSRVISVRGAGVRANKEVTLYPNPVTQNYLMVQLKNFAQSQEPVVFTLSDLAGKTLVRQDLRPDQKETRIDLQAHSLNKGMYLVSISSQGDSQLKRIVIE